MSSLSNLTTSDTPSDYAAAFDIAIPAASVAKHSFRLACDLEPVRSLGGGLHADGGQFK